MGVFVVVTAWFWVCAAGGWVWVVVGFRGGAVALVALVEEDGCEL